MSTFYSNEQPPRRWILFFYHHYVIVLQLSYYNSSQTLCSKVSNVLTIPPHCTEQAILYWWFHSKTHSLPSRAEKPRLHLMLFSPDYHVTLTLSWYNPSLALYSKAATVLMLLSRVLDRFKCTVVLIPDAVFHHSIQQPPLQSLLFY